MNFSPLRSKIRQWLIELRQEVMDNSGNPYNPASNIKGYDPLLTIRKTLSAVTTAQSGQDLLDALNYLEKDYLKRNSKLSKYLLNIRGPQLIAEVNTQLNEYIKSCDKCIGSELVTSAEQKQAIAKEEKSVAKKKKLLNCDGYFKILILQHQNKRHWDNARHYKICVLRHPFGKKVACSI
ncbi:hypothetical protein GW537_16415 (plasmid) [Piscirickettsia salmonis]|uniref:hypothetical protein n=1 Tax=Piscirickettsia salmonis TaxID=1238 RepID=UPI00137C0CAD|nr:hypothetical protein [Piscirickettsia salmonis]QHS30708.1 hypothetical protein GW537_16415 [Piscirickettsia salmonis]